MATATEYFKVHAPSDLALLHRKNRPLSDKELANATGTSPVPLVTGEFLAFNADYHWIRATSAAAMAWAYYEEKGDHGVYGYGRASTLFLGNYEADTLVYNSGQAWALGDPVMIGAVNNSLSGSVARVGLIIHSAVATDIVIGRVTRLPASNNSKLRFVTTMY